MVIRYRFVQKFSLRLQALNFCTNCAIILAGSINLLGSLPLSNSLMGTEKKWINVINWLSIIYCYP